MNKKAFYKLSYFWEKHNVFLWNASIAIFSFSQSLCHLSNRNSGLGTRVPGSGCQTYTKCYPTTTICHKFSDIPRSCAWKLCLPNIMQ